MSALDRAVDYLRRGWRPIPVPHRRKAPTIPGWPTLRLDADELAAHFNGGPLNVGVLLGEPSGGLVDVDLDCREALRLAPAFLPPTRSRFGRPSKRASHWLYIVTTPVESEAFKDPDAGRMLVELRASGQTVFPGSVHESGEVIEWDEDGELARGDGATLRRAVAALAAACVLARHWPAPGSRHAAALAAAGLLVRGGLDEALAVQIVHQAALAAGDDEAAERKRDVLTTAAKVAAGEAVTGGPTLAETLRGDGRRVVEALKRWLGLQNAADEPLTDVTNAARFVEQHASSFRYCYAWSSWLHWDGTRWRRDAGDAALRAAKETARGWFTEAAAATDEARRKALARWATYACSEPGIRRMLMLAQADLAVTPDQLDADPWLFNCQNGTLELRTGHLRPHRREDLITRIAAAPYDPTARSAVWETFLESALPDEGAREFAQRYAGYALTGCIREEAFVFCRGPAGAGKSTFTEGLRRTWGDYAASADFSTFLARKPGEGPREDIARLAGVRLVTSVETRDGQRLAEGLVKLLTGGDTVTARRLYERSFEFQPAFKLLLASNYRPKASADDDGLWRRLRELPFPTARPHREDRDETVKATITDPAQTGAAILAWAVEGCARWLAEGLGEPEAVMRATAAYRRSQEPLADFVRDCCQLGPDLTVPAFRLRGEYESWCAANGVRHPLTGRAWGEALRALGCSSRHTRSGWIWEGIDLRLVEEAPDREPGEDDPPW
ncbi:MAG TPA: phage/plasmid primase, P4 family [Dehalococcoidia bacterium]|nr:phage/plasmid primase, P4 family [Dehalococcoidia bacterium]